MSDLTIRLLVVGSVIVVVAIVALVARRLGTPYHAPVDLDGLDLPAGLVLFTSTECEKCRKARAVVKATGAPLREVTYEIEAAMFERGGVSGVPLTVVIEENGGVVAQFAGVPSWRRLNRALAEHPVGKP
jgi:hypothetical protein